MPWLELVDGVVWLVTLAISVFLGAIVYRRRDPPARLFLGMVLSLAVLQLCQIAQATVHLLTWWSPGPESETFTGLVQSLWPFNAAALVVFGALTLHLFLIFPTPSRVIRAWRWNFLLLYVPAACLVLMILSRIPLGAAGYRTFWGLDRLGIQDNTLQLVFVILALSTAILRLSIIYFSRATPLVRQQLAWIFWGFLVGGGLAILTDYLPRALDLPRLAGLVPGLDQLPTLIMLGAFALSILRYHIFDVNLVINRSVVYSTLVVLIGLLYLTLTTGLMSLFASAAPHLAPTLVAAITTLVVVLVALPLRDAIQRLVDRWFLRYRADYRELLQGYSRVLTTLVALPRLLSTIADQIDQVLHPNGLAIVLAENDTGYQVKLSRGALAVSPLWQRGAHLDRHEFVPSQLTSRHQPFYLPWHVYDVPAHQREEWQQLEESAAHVFIPMHLRGELVGWLVLGPKLSELAYTRHDLGFLCALADQSCVALDNARLYSEMQRRATELAMLALVSSAISSSLDVARVLETIVESVVQVIGCDKSAIFELSEDGKELSLRMGRGLSPAYIEASRHLKVDQDARARALAQQKPLIVTDIRTDPLSATLIPLAEQEGYRTVIDVPLAGREGALGLLSVYFGQVHEPTVGELEILTTFASQATIAIENARLYAAVSRERDRVRSLYQQTDAALAHRVDELTTIEQVSRQLTGTLDLDQIMILVLQQSKRASQADRGVISLYDPERRILHLLAQDGYPPEMERYRTEPWPDERGITGRVARTGQPALVLDVRRDPDYVASASTTRSQISVPIVWEGGVIGTITLESDQATAFTEEHLRFAELLADHAAIGIHNARLFQQVTDGRDRLQAILNSTSDAVVMLDQQGQAILINPQVCNMLGPAVEQWLRSVNLFAEDEVMKSGPFLFTNLSASEITSLIRHTQEHPDEEIHLSFSFGEGAQCRYFESTASPVLGTAGKVIGRVVVIRDVTRRQELEQFREDLISMVIHNLQGPLAALITSLEIVAGGDADDPAMTAELLRIALESGQKLYGRIESLLVIRRLEDKQMPLRMLHLPLPGVVQMVVDEYTPVATTAGVTLAVNCPPDLPAVQMDEEMISRVFSNLLDNALKYTPTGGRIEIGVTLQKSPESAAVLCAVSDTGPGIASHLTELVFDKFRQGENSLQARRKGMGIGLYYCKLAVEAHGGRIWVESEEGQGTTFYFTLPVTDS
jgi:NtrC-family two-component system sensor histidine kinase KinB